MCRYFNFSFYLIIRSLRFIITKLLYHLLIFKMMIIIIKRVKLIDIKVILNIKVKVNIIIFNVVIYFKILIIYSLKIALKTIFNNKFKFIRFIDNISIIIKNLIV